MIRLPDFQRGYKWDEERVRQLLVTVLRGHPMDVIKPLETGNDQVRFKPRPVEGTTARFCEAHAKAEDEHYRKLQRDPKINRRYGAR